MKKMMTLLYSKVFFLRTLERTEYLRENLRFRICSEGRFMVLLTSSLCTHIGINNCYWMLGIYWNYFVNLNPPSKMFYLDTNPGKHFYVFFTAIDFLAPMTIWCCFSGKRISLVNFLQYLPLCFSKS